MKVTGMANTAAVSVTLSSANTMDRYWFHIIASVTYGSHLLYRGEYISLNSLPVQGIKKPEPAAASLALSTIWGHQ